MPPECKAYDCKEDKFYLCAVKYAPLVWDGDKWEPSKAIHAQFIGESEHIDKLTETINRYLKKYGEFYPCESSDSTS